MVNVTLSMIYKALEMKHFILASLFFIFSISISFGQYVTLQPSGVGPNDEATLIFDASEGNGELMGASKVYVHHGVITSGPEGTDWQYVIGNWGQDDGVGEMTKVDGETDKWQITFSPSIREYFGVPEGTDIFRISCVFRSADGNTKGTLNPGDYGWGDVASNLDVYVDLNVENYISILAPADGVRLINKGESIRIEAEASSSVSSMKILIDEGLGFNEVAGISSGTNISYDFFPEKTILIDIKVTATINGENLEETISFNVAVAKDPEIAPLPEGVIPGINYHKNDDTKATLVLEAPGKSLIAVVGDFTDWIVDDDFQMKKTEDGEYFWYELEGLVPGKEYVYQYWIDGDVIVADMYADKIADPWNDPFIENEIYPDLPPYDRRDLGIASVLQTGQTPYEWGPEEDTWQRPDVDHLMIYELHIRDFLASHSYTDLIDTLPYLKELGIDAIELMPINEFEGNDSWGYNPSFFFAPDKYYGPKDELKRFIEESHKMGIAVILDIVLNHSFLQSPTVLMYFDWVNFKPSSDNPWMNREYVGQYQWGFDFNHESPYTQRFVDRVNRYWLEEYHFDGYRFDFTKGFTNYAPGGSVDGYDASRIAILKRMADEIWEYDSEAYVILEHWSPFQEEEELGAYGMKMWANRSYDFVPMAVGNITGSFNNMERSTHVSLISSHDERRVGEHILTEGRSNSFINLQDTVVMFERVKMTAAFAYLYPGPKMMWQFDELGYDIDINLNGRTGRKPYVWGQEGNGYYEDPLRQYIYDTYKGILDVRNTITPQALASAATNHKESGATRRLSYDTDDIDLVVIGNFGLTDQTIVPSFTQTGTWYNYFSGDSMVVEDLNAELELKVGEWHIFTTTRLSDGLPVVVETYSNPVTISPFPFTMDDEITITFDASLAFPDDTDGLEGAEKVYIQSGVIEDSPSNKDLTYEVGNLVDDGIGQMTKVSGTNDKWEITLVPRQYFSTPADLEVFKLGMYFRDANNENRGLGFRNSIIYYDVASSADFVWIDPVPFDSDSEITIYFNAAQGNRELVGADKVYMHSGMSIVDSDNPANNAWNNVVGNWGMDDGVGQMTKVEGEENIWKITLRPTSYYGLSNSDTPTWLAAVFRNADGSLKGTGEPGELSNGFIAENQDFFIRNRATTSTEDVMVLPYEIYPNPTSGMLNLSQFPDSGWITLYDLTGKTVFSEKVSGQKIVDISDLEKGIFLYHISTVEGVKSGKIMHF